MKTNQSIVYCSDPFASSRTFSLEASSLLGANCWAGIGAYCEAWIVACWGSAALNAVLARTLAAAPPVRIPDLALSLVLEDTVALAFTTSGSLLY